MKAFHRHPERIAVGIDGSTASHAAVRWAIDHAQPGDTVVLLHAWQAFPATVETGLVDADDDSGAQNFVRHELARIAALPRQDAVTVTGDVFHGDARDCLCDADADLLVVGAGAHSSLVGALLGSVSAHLARQAHRPVVIVPNPCVPVDREQP